MTHAVSQRQKKRQILVEKKVEKNLCETLQNELWYERISETVLKIVTNTFKSFDIFSTASYDLKSFHFKTFSFSNI